MTTADPETGWGGGSVATAAVTTLEGLEGGRPTFLYFHGVLGKFWQTVGCATPTGNPGSALKFTAVICTKGIYYWNQHFSRFAKTDRRLLLQKFFSQNTDGLVSGSLNFLRNVATFLELFLSPNLFASRMPLCFH